MENENINPYPSIEEELENIKAEVAAVPKVDAPELFPPIPGFSEDGTQISDANRHKKTLE